MKLSTSARAALHAALAMAQANAVVTVAQVARRHGLSEATLAKVFQTLVRAGIAQGARGAGGGYRLAQPARATTVLQVLETFDPPRPEPHMADGCPLRRLFAEVDEVARATLASVSLETLARRTPLPAQSP